MGNSQGGISAHGRNGPIADRLVGRWLTEFRREKQYRELSLPSKMSGHEEEFFEGEEVRSVQMGVMTRRSRKPRCPGSRVQGSWKVAGSRGRKERAGGCENGSKGKRKTEGNPSKTVDGTGRKKTEQALVVDRPLEREKERRRRRGCGPGQRKRRSRRSRARNKSGVVKRGTDFEERKTKAGWLSLRWGRGKMAEVCRRGEREETSRWWIGQTTFPQRKKAVVKTDGIGGGRKKKG